MVHLTNPVVPLYSALQIVAFLRELDLKKGQLRATFLSAFTSFSMPHDATELGLRIECMYPADAGTDAFARALAAQG